MLFLWSISVLVAFLCSNVLSLRIDLADGLARRQFFTTIGLATTCTGTSCTKKSSSSTISQSSSTSSPTSSSTSSSSSPTSSRFSTVSSTTSTASTTGSYNQYALTTTFTQPPACTGGFTAIQDLGTEIYENLIYSRSGFNLSYTTCFPPQFYSSVLASIASTTLGPFTALICPYTWENYAINSTYVICCPRGFSFLAPNLTDTIRPGGGAFCYSSIGAYGLVDITTFDSTGGQTFVPTTAGPDGTIVWANAFDGITTIISTTTSSTTTSSSSLSSKPSTSSSSSSSKPSTSSSSSSSKPSTSSSSSSSKPSTSSSSSLSKPATSSSSSSSSKPSTSSSSSSSKSTTSSSSSRTTSVITTSSSTTTTGTAIPGESALPACGQLCFNNMLAQYSSLGCNALDSYCLCSNVNFGYGIRDCSNGACGTDVASTVIAFGSAYCSSATATHIVATSTVNTAIPGESALPACGQLCFNNMLAQYSSLGCNALDSYCLCSNVNFGYGIRDCSNGACGTDVASTVIAFGSAYCSSATATHTTQSPSTTAH